MPKAFTRALLTAGEPRMRVALTNTRIVVHQPSGGAQGMAADRDKCLESDEAQAFGLIDVVFDKRPESGDDAGTDVGEVTPA